MKKRAKVLVPSMTEAEALDTALRLWGENAWVLAHSENNVCVSGGKGSRAYGEGESFEMAFVDADRRAYLWSRVTGEVSTGEIADIAYVFIPEQVPGKRVGCIHFLENGYYSTFVNDEGMTRDQAETFVTKVNERLGIPADVVEAMHCGSMFGWQIPAARKALDFFAGQKLANVMATAANTPSELIADKVIHSILSSAAAVAGAER
jgi:hypothetical protein